LLGIVIWTDLLVASFAACVIEVPMATPESRRSLTALTASLRGVRQRRAARDGERSRGGNDSRRCCLASGRKHGHGGCRRAAVRQPDAVVGEVEIREA